MSKFLSLLLLVVVLCFACQRQEVNFELTNTPFLKSEATWADSILFSMTVDEKIAQLLIFQPTLEDSISKEKLIRLSEENKIGGILLENLVLDEYLQMVDSLQKISKIPLFNASRQQISLHNQFSDITDLPQAASISAIKNDTLQKMIFEYYLDQLEVLGINFNFTPLLNINAVDSIGFDYQVFENEPSLKLERSSKLLESIQSRNKLSIAGDFDDLYYLENDTIGALDSILFRYTKLVEQGVSGIHIDKKIFQIDTLDRLPPHFIKRYLREHSEFNGLLIADWEEEPFQHLAYSGADLFVVKDDFENRFKTVKDLVEVGSFTKEDLNEKVRKVLLAKSWMGLDTIRPSIDQDMAKMIMNSGFDDYEIRRMYESSLMLLQNPKAILPIKNTYQQPFKIVQVGDTELWEFQNYFSKYASFSHSNIQPDSFGNIEALDFYRYGRSKIILTLDQITLFEKRDSAFIKSINDLGQKTEVVVVNFGNPENLIHFDTTIALVHNFERSRLTESLSAQLLFGALQAKGKLPLALSDRLPIGTGIDDTPIVRMKYTVPEEVGIAAYKLVGIDAIARSAINGHATPGCQVLVAKDGKIIYSKSFGRHDFEKGKLVQSSDLYDLASITKVASTTIGLMRLYDEGKVRISHTLDKHLEFEKKSKLKKLSLKQLLTHTSGLQSNMPIAPFIMFEDTTGTGCSEFFCNKKEGTYIVPIADSIFMDFKWQDSIWQDVFQLSPRKRKRYRYSDVNFNLLMKVIEEQEDNSLDNFVYKNFYNPMNLNRLTYNPMNRFSIRSIVPTTNEERFRNQLIHGYVHDESAALLGGVGGNAGLFGNAESLAPLFHMLLNEGSYGGTDYLTKETIALFTKKQAGSNRGLGFDLNHKKHGSCSPKASSKTFGHTGFTGTCAWADPETGLVYIFLSNRIHPDIKNRQLFRARTRTRIHNLIYDALDTYPEKEEEESKATMMEAKIEN